MPDPRQQTCCAAVDGKIYVFGDYNSSPINNRAEVYNPQTDTWTQLANMPTGRGQATSAAVAGIIYVFGGNNCFSNCWLNTVEAYNTTMDTWTSGLAPMPGTTRGWLSATAVGGKIYVMGGVNSYVVPTFDYNAVYDPATNTWTTGSPIPNHGRSHHGAAVLDGKIYLVGGTYRLQHSVPFAVPEVDVFDPATDTWTSVAPLPTPRQLLTVVAMGGRIYAIGGLVIGPDGQAISPPVGLVEEYDPQLDCWTTVIALPTPQDAHCSAVVNSTIYSIGGSDGNSTLATNQTGSPRPISGDMNGDGQVDGNDIQEFINTVLNG